MKKIILLGLVFLSIQKQPSFKATFYGKWHHGKITTSGEIFNMYKMTCATKYFPIGTKLKVTNPENNKSVIVKVNDHKKYYNTLLDLSEYAFRKIGNTEVGVINVKVLKLN
jgi:rare lipoprotein A